MKKAISLVLMVAMLVCLMPAMAFAAEGDAPVASDVKAQLKLESGDTTAAVTAYDDYRAVVTVEGTSVNSAYVTATLLMQGVAGLGMAPGEVRKAEYTLNTGNDPATSEIQNFVKTIMEQLATQFTGCTINGNIDGKAFTYNVGGFTATGDNAWKCEATPEDVDAVRAAWQALSGMVVAATEDTADSHIFIPAGTSLKIGNEYLAFTKDCDVNPSATEGGMAGVETAIRDAAQLTVMEPTEDSDAKSIVLNLKKGSVLQVSSSSAVLVKDLEISSDAQVSDGYLTALQQSDSISGMVLQCAMLALDVMTNANGGTVNVEVKDVTQYTVTVIDGAGSATYNAGEVLDGLADPTVPDGKIFVGWFDQDGKEAKNGDVVTKDMTLTAKFKNAPYKITFVTEAQGATVTYKTCDADGETGLIAAEDFPAAPTMTGYTFNGWFVGDEKVTAETVFTADTTVTAKFTKDENPVNPPVGPTTPVNPGATVTPPPYPPQGDVEIDDPDTPLDQLPVEEQIAAVQAAKIKATSKMTTLNGKKAVKVSWKVPADIEALGLDGYQVFRSTKRYSGFGKKPIFETTKKTYTNNKDLVKGNTYYYKVRGYKVIEGKKYYTTWSTKAWRVL